VAREAQTKGVAPHGALKEANAYVNERVAALYDAHEQLLLEMGLWAGVQPIGKPDVNGDLYVHVHVPTLAVVPVLASLYLWPYKYPIAR
jgi:hypothetical protein